MSEVPAQDEVLFNFGSSVVKGRDGKAWVQLHFQMGVLTQLVQLPESNATEFLEVFPAQLHETIIQARRANLGLLLPGNVQFPTTPKNGNPHGPS